MSSQIWCYLKFPLPTGNGGSPKKVAQNNVKHILVLEFWRSDDFWGVVEGGAMKKLTSQQAYNQPRDTMMTR